ncbi:hypothetical protein MMC06_000710 [Schaereria dolodes]|nr:hypothetical protein [Schaereria dolodes]
MKRQWSRHEATKKRNEIQREEQLRPLPKSPPMKFSLTDKDVLRRSMEQERDKILHKKEKHSPRKVFAGSKHTRTLSLLSPTSSIPCSSPKKTSALVATQPKACTGDTRGSFVSNTIKTKRETPNNLNSTGNPKEAILETGKQMMGDFRHGIWTFIEDLRQATVGDEAIKDSSPRFEQLRNDDIVSRVETDAQSVPQTPEAFFTSSKVNGALRSVSPILKSCETLADQARRATPASSRSDRLHACLGAQKSIETTTDDTDDDGWAYWESSKGGKVSSCRSTRANTPETISSPLANNNSSRTSLSSPDTAPVPITNDLPWPALTDLSPGKLTKTASTMMTEW